MKQFVVTLEFAGGGLPDLEVIRAQQEFVDKLYAEGTLVLAGPFDDGRGGMAVVRSDSLEHVNALYRESPFVRSGHATSDTREWKVMKGSLR